MENPQGAEDIPHGFMAIVVKAHQATDGSQLDLRVNDIVVVLEQDETGWWGGHKEREDATGWFPGSCVRLLGDASPGREAMLGAHLEGNLSATMMNFHAADDRSPCGEDAGLGWPAMSGLDSPGTARRHQYEVTDGADPEAQTARCCVPLETELRSPMRRSRVVASPQRAKQSMDTQGHTPGTDGLRGLTTPIAVCRVGGAPSVPGGNELLTVELAQLEQLKKENAELHDQLKRSQRQSDVERRNFKAAEAAVQREREAREQAEHQLQVQNAEKERLAKKAAELAQQLEREHAQLERERAQRERERVELERERRSSQAVRDSCEQMQQLYQKRLQEKDEEIHEIRETGRKSCQKTRLLEEQLRNTQEEMRREQRTSAAEVSVADETRRRLFSEVSASPSQRASHPAPSVAGSRPVTQRPPEPPRSSSMGPQPKVVSPTKLGHALSAADLASRSSDHGGHCSPPRARREDRAALEVISTGCVAEKRRMFEQRCSTPRGLRAGTCEGQDRTSGVSGTIPILPRGLPVTLLRPHGQQTPPVPARHAFQVQSHCLHSPDEDEAAGTQVWGLAPMASATAR